MLTPTPFFRYHEGEQLIRRGGTKIYESFIATGGTDIKVYTVTGLYAHAEGRKAPVVDGKVRPSPLSSDSDAVI
jgi:hypothetical protein